MLKLAEVFTEYYKNSKNRDSAYQ